MDDGGESWRTRRHHVREHHRTGPQTVDLPGGFVQRLARKKDKQGMFPTLGHIVVLDIRIDHTVVVVWDHKAIPPDHRKAIHFLPTLCYLLRCWAGERTYPVRHLSRS